MPPTYYGYIADYADAEVLVNAVIRGILPSCKERLDEKSKRNINAGQIYVFLDSQCGLKRWTDSKSWSKSRKLGEFFYYRELDANQRILLEGGLQKKTCQVQLNGETGHVVCYFDEKGQFIRPSSDPFLCPLITNYEISPNIEIPCALTTFPTSYFQ